MVRVCKECGFILGTRPGIRDVEGVCVPCINSKRKQEINFKERQEWLTQYIKDNVNPNAKWDAVVGVSGGKDSSAIVRRLIENHGLKNPLLVNVTDEFIHSKAGEHNLKKLAEVYNLDTLVLRCQPETFKNETKKIFLKVYIH